MFVGNEMAPLFSFFLHMPMKTNCLLSIGASDQFLLRDLPDDLAESINGGVVGTLRRRRASRPPASSSAPSTGSSSPVMGRQSFVLLSNVNFFQTNYVFNLIFGSGNSILNMLGNQVPIG